MHYLTSINIRNAWDPCYYLIKTCMVLHNLHEESINLILCPLVVSSQLSMIDLVHTASDVQTPELVNSLKHSVISTTSPAYCYEQQQLYKSHIHKPNTIYSLNLIAFSEITSQLPLIVFLYIGSANVLADSSCTGSTNKLLQI